MFSGFWITDPVNFASGCWITDQVNAISVNYFQPKLFSEICIKQHCFLSE